MLSPCYRASDLRREAGAASKSAAKAAEALQVAQEDGHKAKHTIGQLQVELETIKRDFETCQQSLTVTRSESRTLFEEVRNCREEQRSAIATAKEAQEDAAQKMRQIRNLELQLEAERVRTSRRAAAGEGDQGGATAVEIETDNARKATRRRQHVQRGSSFSTPSQPQQQLHQPGLVVTPEALNWFVGLACSSPHAI